MYIIKPISKFNYEELNNFMENKISNLGHKIAISKNLKKNNLSFVLLSENKIKAFCPMFFENKFSNKKKWKQGSLFGLSLPGLIISNNIDSKEFRKIVSLVLNEIDKLSLKHSISKIQICFSDLVNFDLESEKNQILYRLLLEYKYLNISLTGNRIDLKKDINIIAKSMSKGHKSIISKNKYKVLFYNYESKKLSFEIFLNLVEKLVDYEDQVPLLFEMYNKCILEFAEVFNKETKVAYGVFCKINNTVEYYVSKSINQDIDCHHTMIYEAIKKYKNDRYIEIFF